jgi:molybdopterin-guanine dinucleotide biosynthesis protein MobB
MTQSADAPDIPLPRIVTVVGLKKSGKTTVVTAILSELKSRGISAGSIKKMEHASLFLDPEGTDTRRHAEAGAEVVVALLAGETIRFERSLQPQSLREIARLFPLPTRFLVCEGMADRTVSQLIVVCLRSMGELEETLEVRGIQAGSVLAFSGVGAAGARSGQSLGSRRTPVFDAVDALQRRALVDLLIEASGEPGDLK